MAASCVAPAGVLWHVGNAIASEGELRNEHVECAVKELFKTIGLVSLVALPLLVIYASAEAFLIHTIASVCVLGASFTALKMAATLICPAKKNHWFFGFLVGDKEWCAKMGIKWELGFDVNFDTERFLKDLIEESLKEVLQSIKAIQRKLPREHRLPCSGKLDVHEALLYLEKSRAELMQHGVWDEIKGQRDNLEKYGTLLHRLKAYTEERWGEPSEGIVNLVYSCENTLPLLKARLSPDPRIYSLSIILFQKMLSSDWLFPSNCVSHAIDDKGSIQESMREIDPYENRQQITSYTHTALKPVRYAGRFIATALICGAGAPMGVLYNGCQALRYTLNTAIKKEEEKFENWIKAHAYATAAFNDLTTFLGMVMLLPFIGNGGEVLLPLAFRDTRSALFKAITLKNRFGITGPKGHLLSFDARKDSFPFLGQEAFFGELFDKRSLTLWYALNDIYPALKDKKVFSNHLAAFTNSGNFSPLLTFLSQQQISQEKIKKCQKICEDLIELRGILQDAYSNATSGMSVNIPFHTRTFAFSSEGSPLVIHNEVIESAKKVIVQIEADADTTDDWKQFKTRLFSSGATPQSILQVENLTQEEISASFKKFSLHFHPNKLFHQSDSIKQEGEELFKLLVNLKDMLLKELAKKTA